MPDGRRVLVTGWYSFEGMGASAGDLLARDVVCKWLREAGHPYDVALAAPFTGGIAWEKADPNLYSHVIFVCGPFGNGPPLLEFFERFRACPLVGVNLTMLQPLEAWNPFALLIERDSSRRARPDLVFLSEEPRVPVVGLLLIDAQPEYRDDRRVSVHETIRRFVAGRPMTVVPIDTRLDVNQTGLGTASEVESLVAKMDVVITTRLHGLVLAIKNGVPAIPIDAVAGGAKITRQVEAIGWPLLLNARDLTEEDIGQAFDYCLTPAARSRAAGCAESAKSALASSRAELIDFLES